MNLLRVLIVIYKVVRYGGDYWLDEKPKAKK
jgi:hypothetical protein